MSDLVDLDCPMCGGAMHVGYCLVSLDCPVCGEVMHGGECE